MPLMDYATKAYEDAIRKLDDEIDKLREYIDLLENQVIVAMTADDEDDEPHPRLKALFASPLPWDQPVPFLPVDPEEQRRLAEPAADGSRCMIYRGNS